MLIYVSYVHGKNLVGIREFILYALQISQQKLVNVNGGENFVLIFW
jgi:hypothetical protein